MGRYYRLLEQRRDLEIFIKELEKKRSNEDLLNVNKFNELYKVYYEICDIIDVIDYAI